MLKKELCKKCKKKFDITVWDGVDEMWWKEGVIWCPDKYVEKGEGNPRSITNKPPIRCPYYLENIL